MSNIAILGLGNWGSALAHVWSQDGHKVVGWTVESEVKEAIEHTGENTPYLPGYSLEDVSVTMELERAVATAEVVVLALPSRVILEVVETLGPVLRPSHVLVDLAKGLAPAGEDLLSSAIESRLAAAGKSNPVAVLSGPTIAPEVARGVMTTALVACRDHSVAERLCDRLSTERLLLQPGDDPAGAELWGAYKNTVALAAGVVDGLGEAGGDNLKAAVVAAGFRSGQTLLTALGAQAETAFGPAGLGDLFVTVTSPFGRNRQMGEHLGSGLSLEQALGEMTMVAEGVPAARLFAQRAEEIGVGVPFLGALNALLDGDVGPAECMVRIVRGQ